MQQGKTAVMSAHSNNATGQGSDECPQLASTGQQWSASHERRVDVLLIWSVVSARGEIEMTNYDKVMEEVRSERAQQLHKPLGLGLVI